MDKITIINIDDIPPSDKTDIQYQQFETLKNKYLSD